MVVSRHTERVAAFLLLLLVVIALALWNDRQIDRTEKRITSNRASVTDLRQANERQNELSNQIIRTARRSDLTICREVEKVKERIRANARLDEAEARQTLRDLGINPDSPRGQSLLEQARVRERETLERFAARNCKALITRP